MEQVHTCAECCKIYKHYRSLKYHVKKSHPAKLSELAPSLHDKKTFKYSCDECNKNFNNEKNLNFHKRRVHKVFKQGAANLKCPMCKKNMSKNDIINHFQFIHDLTIETEKLEFSSLGTFLKWKEEMEKNSKCSFKTKSGSYQTSESTKHQFACHRSGEYVPEGYGIRQLKLKGSKKIGGFCPAEIKVTESNDSGKVSIHFTKTHVGHQNDDENASLEIDVGNEEINNESRILIHQLQKKYTADISKKDIALVKEDLKRKFVEAVDKITTKQEIEIFENILKSLNPTLCAVHSTTEHSFQTASTSNSSMPHISHNKNIEPQRRLFSTKKKRKLVESAIVEATQQELQNITLSLLLDNNNE